VPSFIPFPFGFFIFRCSGKALKIHFMQKLSRLVSPRRRLALCPLSVSIGVPVPPVSPLVFSRHFRRLPSHRCGDAVVVSHPCGWFVWCFPSGRRQLCALPF
jgi:hypothetical protein